MATKPDPTPDPATEKTLDVVRTETVGVDRSRSNGLSVILKT